MSDKSIPQDGSADSTIITSGPAIVRELVRQSPMAVSLIVVVYLFLSSGKSIQNTFTLLMDRNRDAYQKMAEMADRVAKREGETVEVVRQNTRIQERTINVLDRVLSRLDE